MCFRNVVHQHIRGELESGVHLCTQFEALLCWWSDSFRPRRGGRGGQRFAEGLPGPCSRVLGVLMWYSTQDYSIGRSLFWTYWETKEKYIACGILKHISTNYISPCIFTLRMCVLVTELNKKESHTSVHAILSQWFMPVPRWSMGGVWARCNTGGGTFSSHQGRGLVIPTVSDHISHRLMFVRIVPVRVVKYYRQSLRHNPTVCKPFHDEYMPSFDVWWSERGNKRI